MARLKIGDFSLNLPVRLEDVNEVEEPFYTEVDIRTPSAPVAQAAPDDAPSESFLDLWLLLLAGIILTLFLLARNRRRTKQQQTQF